MSWVRFKSRLGSTPLTETAQLLPFIKRTRQKRTLVVGLQEPQFCLDVEVVDHHVFGVTLFDVLHLYLVELQLVPVVQLLIVVQL